VIQALNRSSTFPSGTGDDAMGAVVGQAMHWALTDRATRRGTEIESAEFSDLRWRTPKSAGRS
jgi:hypothetical protein